MKAFNMFWSCEKGSFVNKRTGEKIPLLNAKGVPVIAFNGTQNEWNECLIETIIDAMNTVRAKAPISLRVNPKANNKLLETSVLYKSTSNGDVILHSPSMVIVRDVDQEHDIISICDNTGDEVATVTILDFNKAK